MEQQGSLYTNGQEAGENGKMGPSAAESWVFKGGNQKPITMPKPYGEISVMGVTRNVALTRVILNADESLSTQAHDEKDELYYIDKGYGEVEIVDRYGQKVIYQVEQGDVLHIPPGMIHTVTAGTSGLTIWESSTPEVCNVIRIHDPHGRPGSNPNYKDYSIRR